MTPWFERAEYVHVYSLSVAPRSLPSQSKAAGHVFIEANRDFTTTNERARRHRLANWQPSTTSWAAAEKMLPPICFSIEEKSIPCSSLTYEISG